MMVTQSHWKFMKRIFPILLLVVITLAAGYWLGQRGETAMPRLDLSSGTQAVYICPMHSHIVQDHPGTCPICGMDLVPAANSETGQRGADAQIQVDTSTQQKFGVRLATAELGPLARETRAYATLIADAGATQRITPTVEGVLVKLHAARPGQRIAAGEPLYEIFSQDLLQLQNEYIDYYKRRSQSLRSADETRTRNRQMLESMHGQDPAGREEITKGMSQTEEQISSMLLPMSRDGERLTSGLKLAGFSDAMLQQLIHKGKSLEVVTIRAQHACTVTEVSAHAGMAVATMTDILSCTDSGRAWLEVVLYPDQAGQVQEGDTVTVEFADGASMHTRLTGLSAISEGEARTVRARIPFKLGAERHLGDYADVTIKGTPFTALSIPASAVIRSGRGNFVMRALENGHFMPQEIEAGISSTDRIVVRDGLEAGDKVAVNGQFLLDAAASIADTAQRYKQTTGAAK
jgi:Cu(I)/Ag(I) efflux system membrane fusion protein